MCLCANAHSRISSGLRKHWQTRVLPQYPHPRMHPLSHRQAVIGMLVVTLMWSTAGFITRQLDAAQAFEVTFWRSLFLTLALAGYFVALHGRDAPRILTTGGRPLWISGLMWSVMFTCFMVALTLTTVANVLITMSIAPLLTALLARFMLGHPVRPRTWGAIVVPGAGVAWVDGHNLSAHPKHPLA